MNAVFIVYSPNGDVELLDRLPRWDWPLLGQTVRVGSVNGGDSLPVPYAPALDGHTDACAAVVSRRALEREIETDANPYLLGAYPEYSPDGDQTVELCDCGALS